MQSIIIWGSFNFLTFSTVVNVKHFSSYIDFTKMFSFKNCAINQKIVLYPIFYEAAAGLEIYFSNILSKYQKYHQHICYIQ